MAFHELSNRVIDCVLEAQQELGSGLLESTYEQCLSRVLKCNDIRFKLSHQHLVL
ncbi:MAG: GxxExxY protein [Candidatus Bipolaricaulota bacterium]|nr:GxxExxY protein [Candidatus Bipolaricaulota bacterium]